MSAERRTLFTYLAAALMIAALVALHTYHFRDRNYRQDEIITAHASTFRSPAEVVQWMATDIHPPLWRVTATTWAAQFGQDEPITRFLSTLFTAVTLALVFRLGADLFNRRVGLLAVFVLGTLAYFQFYSHEYRPYPALMMFSAAAQLALLRWLRAPNFRHALLYVLAGSGAIYTHYFGLFVIVAQVAVCILLVRWNWGLYLRAAGLFLAIALSYLGWLPAFANVLLISRPEGVTYATDTSYAGLVYIHNAMQIRPYGLGMFLLLVGLVTPISAPGTPRFRFGAAWRKLYLVLFAGVVLLIVIVGNARYGILTERNLSIIVPPLAILAAFALACLPRRWFGVAALLILLPALFDPVSLEPNAPYKEALATMRPAYGQGDKIVFNLGNLGRQNLVFSNYLGDRLPVERVERDMYLVRERQTPGAFADETVRPAAELRESFAQFLDEAPQVWYLQTSEFAGVGRLYQGVLARDYLLVEQWTFSAPTYLRPHTLSLYRRIPDAQNPIQLGDVATLFSWTLQNEVNVQPCQTVTLESWWRAEAQPDRNYSMTLVLADSSGIGVTRADSEPAGVLTQQWQQGAVYVDTRSVQVPCDAAPGDYLLLVGWYDYETLENLPAALEDGTALGGLAYLTTLHVSE